MFFRLSYYLLQLNFLLLFSCNNSNNISSHNTFSLDTSIVSNGDIVFRRGRDIMAKMVLAQGDSSRFSHVGILIKTKEGLSVIHAIPSELNNDGIVLVESIPDFFSNEKASTGSIYRVKGASSDESELMIKYALKKVGKPFDNNFNFSEDSSYYCTELVLKSITAGGKNIKDKIRSVDILTIKEPVFLPDNLRISNQLEKILEISLDDK